MDDADPKLERSIEPLRHHLRKPTPYSSPDLSPQTSFPPTRTQKDLQAPYLAKKPASGNCVGANQLYQTHAIVPPIGLLDSTCLAAVSNHSPNFCARDGDRCWLAVHFNSSPNCSLVAAFSGPAKTGSQGVGCERDAS